MDKILDHENQNPLSEKKNTRIVEALTDTLSEASVDVLSLSKQKYKIFDQIVENQSTLTRSELIAIWKHICEHSIEDGRNLGNRLGLTMDEKRELFSNPSILLKNQDLIERMLTKFDDKKSLLVERSWRKVEILRQSLEDLKKGNMRDFLYSNIFNRNEQYLSQLPDSRYKKLYDDIDNVYVEYMRQKKLTTSNNEMEDQLFSETPGALKKLHPYLESVMHLGSYPIDRIVETLYEQINHSKKVDVLLDEKRETVANYITRRTMPDHPKMTIKKVGDQLRYGFLSDKDVELLIQGTDLELTAAQLNNLRYKKLDIVHMVEGSVAEKDARDFMTDQLKKNMVIM